MAQPSVTEKVDLQSPGLGREDEVGVGGRCEEELADAQAISILRMRLASSSDLFGWHD